MMISYLVSIGCDIYESENLDNLSGATNDANNIYNCLVESQYSIYSQELSIVLPSPSLSEVKQSLENILFDNETPDVITLFFAGHGGVQLGSYYLCLRDTKLERMSLTAFSLSELFRIVSSSGVKHINLIIDACNTGGLVNDLITIIKPEIMGAKDSLGIAILAAAASDEYAGEIEGQGLLTSNLIEYVNGTKQVTTNSKYLDLTSIGKDLSTAFIKNTMPQTPSYWGINLYGPSIFTLNPYYNPDEGISTHDFSYIPPASRLGLLIKGMNKELWEAFDNIGKSENLNLLLTIFQKLLKNTEGIDDALNLVIGIGYRFIDKIDTDDSFRKLEVINVMLTSIMPYNSHSESKDIVDNLIHNFSYFGGISVNSLTIELAEQNQTLIHKEGAQFSILANYYYLSVRISKILGLISQLILIDKKYIQEVISLTRTIFHLYQNHLLCMCDSQAPYLYVFFKIFSKLGLGEIVKPFLVRYVSDFLQVHGQVSRIGIEPAHALTFLLQRYTKEKIETEYIENPGQTGSVLILVSEDYELTDDLDSYMHEIDRRPLNLFIPYDINEFSYDLIENGRNLILRCGFDFWTSKEFIHICKSSIKKYANNNYENMSRHDTFCCIASSFLQPNRIPLMLN